MLSLRKVSLALALVLFAAPSGIRAAELIVGQAAPPTSLDPHFASNSQNLSNAQHVFEALVNLTDDDKYVPSLASSWRTIDETTWRFDLRRGVKFHDGSPLTAEDVVFSFKRSANAPGSISNMSIYLKAIADITAIDANTVEIKTKGPAPSLIRDIYNISIVSKKSAENATASEFNSGKAMNGTGPYKFVSYVPDESIVYAKNPDYWGTPEPWDKVTFRIIVNGAARVAAQLSGGVDIIADVPPNDFKNLEENEKLQTWSSPSNRMFYVRPNGSDETLKAGLLVAKDGRPLSKNPLADPQVRKALSLAVNREGIAARIYQGLATPTTQYMRKGQFANLPALPDNPYNLEEARKLLTAAGYPNGFKMTLFASSNRFASDIEAAQALAQMWTRLGVETAVETIPQGTLSTRRFKRDIPIFHYSWGNLSGAIEETLVPHIHSNDKARGLGASNPDASADPEIDKLIEEALVTLDEKRRLEIVTVAAQKSLAAGTLIPLYFQSNVWAGKNTIDFTPRSDGTARAMNTKPKS